MDLAAFRIAYPEFGGSSNTSDAQIEAALAAAAGEMSPPGETPWFEQYDYAQGLLAAHNLAMSPSGKMARLDPKAYDTTYHSKFRQLREQVTCGLRVFGVPSIPGSPWL